MDDAFFLGGVWGANRTPDPGDPGAARRAARDATEHLEARLERAAMTIEAMWSLLRDRLGVTDAELVERIVELDLSDGVLDGRVRRGALECPACGRKIPRRHPRCLYCGADVPHDPFS